VCRTTESKSKLEATEKHTCLFTVPLRWQMFKELRLLLENQGPVITLVRK
jgi:hypothetical protein